MIEKTENKRKRGRGWPILEKNRRPAFRESDIPVLKLELCFAASQRERAENFLSPSSKVEVKVKVGQRKKFCGRCRRRRCRRHSCTRDGATYTLKPK